MSERAAWLSSIELTNVRCFRERQVVPFTTSDGKKAQWTLLLGENGTGKSTVLQACAMAMRSEDHSEAWLRLGEGDVGWTMGGDDSIPPPCLAYAPYRSPSSFIPADTSPTGTRGLFAGFTRLRHPGEWYKDRSFASLNPNAPEYAKKTATSVLAQVREILLSVLPDVEDLQIETEQGGRGENRLRAKTPFGWVDIDKLGMGYQSVLALIVDIASRLVEAWPDSPRPLEEPAVVLIDEIDLHLHPRWQRTLQQELSERFPNVQFIATAHSPLVVQSAPSANLIVLRRQGDHVTIERAPETVQNWRVDQILTSDLFGLPTARPPALDALIEERDNILGKSRLTAADEKRLGELREKIGALPGGESPWEMEAMELIRKAAKETEPPKPSPKKRAGRKTKGSK